MGAALVLEEAGVSHSSSVGSGSKADGSDTSMGNGTGVDNMRIRANGVEQSRASGRTQAFERPGVP
jgi:hypothetical protein